MVHKENDVYGDGVNIAARIEPLAGAGGICITEDVWRQVKNKLSEPLVRLGKGELKNIGMPIDVYRVVLPGQEASSALANRALFFWKKKSSRRAATALLLLLALAGAAWSLLAPRLALYGNLELLTVAVADFENRYRLDWYENEFPLPPYGPDELFQGPSAGHSKSRTPTR